MSGFKYNPPPKTRIDNVVDTIHDTTIIDPYRWLEDQTSSEANIWIDEQNEYTRSVLDSLPQREFIIQRLEQLLKVDTISPPVNRDSRYFFFKRYTAQNQSVIYVRDGLNGKDEAIIDPNALSDNQFVSTIILNISVDGGLLAYGLREGGEDDVTIRLFDVKSKEHISDYSPKGVYLSLTFKLDKSGFYYSRLTKEGSQVNYHRVGTDWKEDIKIFQSFNPAQRIFIDISTDGRYLMLSVVYGSSANRVEIYVQDIERGGRFTPIVKNIDANFSGRIEDGYLFLRTNWQAPNNRIIKIDMGNCARNHWQEIIPEIDSAITWFSLAGGKLFVHYLENACSRIKIFDTSGNYLRDVNFPTSGSADGMWGSWDNDETFYIFNSFVQPRIIYRYIVSTDKQEIWECINIPIKSDQIEVKQVWYKSKDKTEIPMFLVHKRGIQLDGNLPTLLTGYGGFGINQTPNYSSKATFWIENGGVFAMPNLRGGGEFGESWHKDGMLDKKQNTIDDFIAAAEWLIENEYTNPTKLAIYGSSNGGLVVGAAVTQKPHLFKAMICAYPLLDMIRYQRFLYIHFWILEYGSSEDPNQFKFLSEYSPYHRLKPGREYPAVLFITGENDTRVAPLHALKMTAAMQSATISNNPVFLLYRARAGHSGGQPITVQIQNLTDEMSFLLWQLQVH